MLVIIIAVLSGCTSNENGTNNEKGTNNNGKTNEDQYFWSTMDQGPYRDKISYATSTNLLNWVDSGNVLAEHASVPGAMYKDNKIYVYFVDVSVDGIPERIGLIISEDNGTTWLDKVIVNFDGIGDEVPVDPAPFLLDDGRIRLYYYDINEGRNSMDPELENKIYSAISSDGINFVQDGVCFSEKKVFDPDVILVGNIYRMYVGNVEDNLVVSATSSDGLTFTKEGTAYSGGAVPDVFFKNNIYYLYTAGIDISTSTDGASFTKTSSRFESNLNPLTADPSVIEIGDGTFMMFYKTK